jgi:hypothetical protein
LQQKLDECNKKSSDFENKYSSSVVQIDSLTKRNNELNDSLTQSRSGNENMKLIAQENQKLVAK